MITQANGLKFFILFPTPYRSLSWTELLPYASSDIPLRRLLRHLLAAVFLSVYLPGIEASSPLRGVLVVVPK